MSNAYKIFEMDKLYWFIKRKLRNKTRENVYLITLVSRSPRQIIGFDVACDKSPERIQKIVDKSVQASKYCTDGYLGYIDIIYPGEHVRNVRDKSNTYTVEGVNADYLLADRGYDTNKTLDLCQQSNIKAVIPPKRNRLDQRDYDTYLYRLRHLVENAFLHLKRWRGIATRYAKNTSSFVAAIQIKCIDL